jgi:hypothetical protein
VRNTKTVHTRNGTLGGAGGQFVVTIRRAEQSKGSRHVSSNHTVRSCVAGLSPGLRSPPSTFPRGNIET